MKTRKWVRRSCYLFGAFAVLAGFIYLTRSFWFSQLRAYAIGRAYVAAEDYGRHLPEIDEVEIFALAGEAKGSRGESFPSDMGGSAYSVHHQVVKGKDAKRIAAIWRTINFNNYFAAMCHDPVYALRFRARGSLILETTICWKCSTYRLPVRPFGSTLYGFDARSAPALELYETLSRLAPHPPKGN